MCDDDYEMTESFSIGELSSVDGAPDRDLVSVTGDQARAYEFTFHEAPVIRDSDGASTSSYIEIAHSKQLGGAYVVWFSGVSTLDPARSCSYGLTVLAWRPISATRSSDGPSSRASQSSDTTAIPRNIMKTGSAEEPVATSDDDIRWAVEAELAFHDGDAKAAISELIRDRAYLRQQPALAEFAGSRGFARGWRPSFERS